MNPQYKCNIALNIVGKNKEDATKNSIKLRRYCLDYDSSYLTYKNTARRQRETYND